MCKRFLLLLATSFLFITSAYAQTPIIAVAANLKDAFTEIIAAFRVTGKPEFRIVYGSSGNFAAQIMNGAPFHLFIAADERFPLELFKNGKTVDAGSVYAIGKLIIITKVSSGTQQLHSKAEIAKALEKANKVAIAKPELAPYGRAAVEYLKAEGLWDLAKDKLVYGDNVGAATTYVTSGAADLGFSALSLAKSPELSKQMSYFMIDTQMYEPIKQRMVLLKGAPHDAEDLYRFMLSPQAKSILQKYGYSTP